MKGRRGRAVWTNSSMPDAEGELVGKEFLFDTEGVGGLSITKVQGLILVLGAKRVLAEILLDGEKGDE